MILCVEGKGRKPDAYGSGIEQRWLCHSSAQHRTHTTVSPICIVTSAREKLAVVGKGAVLFFFFFFWWGGCNLYGKFAVSSRRCGISCFSRRRGLMGAEGAADRGASGRFRRMRGEDGLTGGNGRDLSRKSFSMQMAWELF